jgi:hypothetical protein
MVFRFSYNIQQKIKGLDPNIIEELTPKNSHARIRIKQKIDTDS